MKVTERIETQNQIRIDENSTRLVQIEDKLRKAADFRESRIEKVKQTAALSAKPKGASQSPAKHNEDC